MWAAAQAEDSGSWRPNGKFKWGGAVHGPDGAVYCLPSDADRVLRTPSRRSLFCASLVTI